MEEKETKYDPTMDQLKHQQAVDRAALSMAQERESIMMDNYNKAQYEDVSQIVSEAETKLAEAKQKDEVAQKRSNAFRYIAGLGDTLSGIANVIGTAHGAANQQQTYNGNMVAEKAEQARKERKIELDQLSTRLDEMKARERELKAAGSLADAQLKAKQGREQLTLKQQQDAIARETKWNLQQQAWKEEEAARAQANLDRNFKEEQRQFDEGQKEKARQFNAEQKRLEEQNEARLQSDEKIAQAKLDAAAAERAEKRANDPKYQSQILSNNMTGIRDEIAKKAGYSSYNEYLQYRDQKRVGDKSRRQTRKFREGNAAAYPEAMQLLDKLDMPENLSEDDIRMLMSASSVFADAVNGGKTAAKRAAEDTNL